jgi:hypothetical protein
MAGQLERAVELLATHAFGVDASAADPGQSCSSRNGAAAQQSVKSDCPPVDNAGLATLSLKRVNIALA